MSNKIGYDTKADSILGRSFQNIFPALYGKVSTGSSDVDVTAQVELPGLPTFDIWDVGYGRYEQIYWVKDETRKTEVQLDYWIQNQITGPTQVLT